VSCLCRLRNTVCPVVSGKALVLEGCEEESREGRGEERPLLPLNLQRRCWSDHGVDLSGAPVPFLILSMELTEKFEELLEVRSSRRLVIRRIICSRGRDQLHKQFLLAIDQGQDSAQANLFLDDLKELANITNPTSLCVIQTIYSAHFHGTDIVGHSSLWVVSSFTERREARKKPHFLSRRCQDIPVCH
jgi:hypothetical protein